MRAAVQDRRLEAIAGPPAFTLTGAAPNPGVPTGLGLAVGDPVTAYSVVDFVSNPASTQSFIDLGDLFNDVSPNTFSVLRRGGGTLEGSRWQVRRTGAIGPYGPYGVGTSGRVVIGWGLDDQSRQHISVLDSPRGTDYVAMAHASSLIRTTNPAIYAPVVTHVYPAAHSPATVSQVQRWLMHRYGITA